MMVLIILVSKRGKKKEPFINNENIKPRKSENLLRFETAIHFVSIYYPIVKEDVVGVRV